VPANVEETKDLATATFIMVLIKENSVLERSLHDQNQVNTKRESSGNIKARVQRKTRRFPFKLRYLTVLVLCGIAAYHYWTVQKVELTELNQEQQHLQTQVINLKAQRSELAKEQKQLNDKAYIERYASEHYHLILPGQVAFNISH